ncbi:MAG: hypothetical protein J0J11_08410, partial [Microbacterium sp.]|nr:hypothetical protein [Microbacterium sp.]
MRFIDTAVEYHGFWGSFWDLIWWFLAVFIFFAFTAGDTGMFASDGILSWMTVTAQLMIIGTGAAL